jgi:hypothetical protein
LDFNEGISFSHVLLVLPFVLDLVGFDFSCCSKS